MTTLKPDAPHYLRFARVLALLAGALTTGCASAVVPEGDASNADTAVLDTAPPDSDPCASLVLEQPCSTPNAFCNHPGCGARCSATTSRWEAVGCLGPLAPPELT